MRCLNLQYKKFGDDFILRIDRGEEVLHEIKKVCEAENILLGSVQGLGATWDVSLGVFNHEAFKYESKKFTGDFEIASCSGNISTINGKCYLHIHAVIGNVTKNEVYAGHLNSAIISLTGEFILHKISGQIDREYSEEIGLNLIKF